MEVTARENSPRTLKQSDENNDDHHKGVTEEDDEASCDMRLLFVSGTGLANEAARPVAGES